MDFTRQFTVITLSVAAAVVLHAQDHEMQAADTMLIRALEKSDKSALQKLLDPDFTWTDAAGKVRNKAAVLRDVPASAIPQPSGAESKAYTYGSLGNVQVNQGQAHVLRVWVKRPTGWKALVYQELMSLESPPTVTPGAGTECNNPCKTIPFTPKDDTERQVAAAYSRLETAAHSRNSKAFAPVVADEFVAASSNSDRLQTKRTRMEEFDRAKDGGVAPTPLLSASMFAFGDAVLMISEHQPVNGKPLRVTRIWVKRDGNWVETLSYQTAVQR